MARRRRPERPPPVDGSIPDELRSRLHPIWADVAAVRAKFPEYVTEADFSSPVRQRSAHMYVTVLNRWARANGYESDESHGQVNWHRMRDAGL